MLTLSDFSLKVGALLVDHNQGRPVFTEAHRGLVVSRSLFDLELHEGGSTVHVGSLGEQAAHEPTLLRILLLHLRFLLIAFALGSSKLLVDLFVDNKNMDRRGGGGNSQKL